MSRLAVWTRRVSNAGVGLAIAYAAYLASGILTSAQNNTAFEGQPLGPVRVDFVRDVADASKLELVPLESSRSSKAAVVVVWATWCGPCHSLLKDLKEKVLAGEADPTRIMAVSIGEPFLDVSAYLQRTPLPFSVALDSGGALKKRFRIAGTPTVIFLDESGLVRRVSTGGFGLAGSIVDFLK